MAKKWHSYLILILLLCGCHHAQVVTPNVAIAPTTTVTDQSANNMPTCSATHASYVGTLSCVSGMVFGGEEQTHFPINPIARSGSTVTATLPDGNFNFIAGTDKVIINGVTDSANFPNGTYSVVSKIGTTQITYTQAGSAVSSSGGTATRGVSSQIFSPAPGNVANSLDGVTIHDLIYRYTGGSANTTRVLFHLMPWFSCPSGGCPFVPKPSLSVYSSHTPTGYVSNSQAQVTAQINAMSRLCGSNPCGVMQDWSGLSLVASSSTRKNENAVQDKIKVAVDARSDDFLYSFVMDDSTWKTAASCGSSGQTPACVEKMIICSQDYANTPIGSTFVCAVDGLTYSGGGFYPDSKFWRDDNGEPIVGTFLDENIYFLTCIPAGSCATYNNGAGGTCGGSTAAGANDDCMIKVFTGVYNHTHLYPVGRRPQFIWRNTWTHPPSVMNFGSLKWQNPTNDNSQDFPGYDTWLTTAGTTTLVVQSGAYKGNDHAQSSFQNDTLVLPQWCGKTWRDSISRPNFASTFTAAKKLQSITVNTWNDHEQGSAIENGVDSCYNFALALNADGHTANYTITTNDSTNAPLSPLNSTIHHIAPYVSIDGVNLQPIGGQVTVSGATGSVDLNSLSLPGGTYSIFFKLVMIAGLQNKWAGPITYKTTIARPQAKVF